MGVQQLSAQLPPRFDAAAYEFTDSDSLAIEIGIFRREAFEAPMDPQVLLGRATDLLLDEPVETFSIGNGIIAGKAIEHGIDDAAITL